MLSAVGGETPPSSGGIDPDGRIAKHEVSVEEEEPLYLELSDFVTSIREGRAPRVTGEQGLAALEVAFDVVRKLRER
jgi:predicted dehydrogenase